MILYLNSIYNKLYSHFGPQYWWPAETSFEVIVGAILTQNTNWLNVEKAIKNLKDKKLLTPAKLHRLTKDKLAPFIKSTGYYNIKAKRLKEFLNFLFKSYHGSLLRLSSADTQVLRRQLLCVNGIGPETADSILLYALNRPVFVIDAYTKRILSRHRFIKENSSYEETQNLFMKNLKNDIKLYNEYHALLVKLGKEFCLKNKPKCNACPLENLKILKSLPERQAQ
ncbi:MAG: endonuclease III domain-containing protein [Candidatus Omnitrophica bacterium]|nr:endonuclease III domain-containing protein [Candidatus Omnitrophota bacterium]